MTTIVTMWRLFEDNEDKDDDIHGDIGYKDATKNICLVILVKDFPRNINDFCIESKDLAQNASCMSNFLGTINVNPKNFHGIGIF